MSYWGNLNANAVKSNNLFSNQIRIVFYENLISLFSILYLFYFILFFFFAREAYVSIL